jgi:hypothetical protein
MKKKFLLIFLTICSFLTGNSIYGQDSAKVRTNQNYKYGIGLGAGFTTGYGISFKYLPNKFGAQINFAPFKNDNTERYSIGLTFIYTLIAAKKTNLYLYQGNHYYYNSTVSGYYSGNNFNSYTPYKTTTTSYVNNGLGIGVRLFLGNRFELNFMTGYASYKNFTNVSLTAETALHYRF